MRNNEKLQKRDIPICCIQLTEAVSETMNTELPKYICYNNFSLLQTLDYSFSSGLYINIITTLLLNILVNQCSFDNFPTI